MPQSNPPRRKRWPYPKDQDGKYLCRCGCGLHPPKGRRYWFSSECVERYRSINDPGYIQRKLLERDKGICAACSIDTIKFWKLKVRPTSYLPKPESHWLRFRERRNYNSPFLRQRYDRAVAVWNKWRARWAKAYSVRCQQLKLAGWNLARKTPYDCDHIVPVAEGGGQCSVDMMQTLCHPCHKRKTAEQARRAALARKSST